MDGRYNLVKTYKYKGNLGRRFKFQKVIKDLLKIRGYGEKLAVLQNPVDDCTLKKELQLLFLCYNHQTIKAQYRKSERVR